MFTTETDEFSKCFNSEVPVSDQIEKWRSILSIYIKKSFKKIRIRKNIKKYISNNMKNLINERNSIIFQKENCISEKRKE